MLSSTRFSSRSGASAALSFLIICLLGLFGCDAATPAGPGVSTPTPLISQAVSGASLDAPTPGSDGVVILSPEVVDHSDSTAVALQTQEAPGNASKQTSIARATASPYPTAEPAHIQTGRPALVSVRRGDTVLELHLPKDSYLAGEVGKAEVVVRNEGQDGISGRDISISLMDGSGEAASWPLMPVTRPLWEGYASHGSFELAPGESTSRTFTFQVPPTEGTMPVSPRYSLSAGTSFNLGSRVRGNRQPDFVKLDLEAGPMPLQISEPQASQHLNARIKADANGYQLSVVDGAGKTPTTSCWGTLEATWQLGSMGSRLQESAKCAWSESWPNTEMTSHGQITLWASVGAEGYVTSFVTETIPLGGPADKEVGAHRENFTSLEAAQAALDHNLNAPTYLPQGVALANVQVDTVSYESNHWSEIRETYRLADGSAIRLTQIDNLGTLTGFGPQFPEFRDAAQLVQAGERKIYVMQHFGLWELVWIEGNAGFQLASNMDGLTLQELVQIAQSVQPLK